MRRFRSITVIALGISSLALGQINLPCCDNRGPGPDTISLECCAAIRLCRVGDAGIRTKWGVLLTQHLDTVSCYECTGWCYDRGAPYVAHGTDACQHCDGTGPIQTAVPPLNLFPGTMPVGVALPIEGEIPEGLPEVPQQVVSSRAVPTTMVMGPDGTLYIVSDTIKIWRLGYGSLRALDFDYSAAVGLTPADFNQHMFHGIAFLGEDARLLWTTEDKGDYTTYLTSLSDYSTVTLQTSILSRSMAFSPSGDLFVIGEGPELATRVHKFSAAGVHLHSFAAGNDPEQVLSTANRVYVQVEPNILNEYQFNGEFVRSYNFDKFVQSGNIGVIHGLFVSKGVLYIGVVPATPGAPDSGCLYGWDATDKMTLYRLVKGELDVDDTGQGDTLLYGITPDGEKVGRSLLVGSKSNPSIIVVDDETPDP